MSRLSTVNPSLATSYDMKPTECSRADYTRGLCEPPIPPSASQKWVKLAEHLRTLYRALGFHPAMEPNLSQTFSTPANSKNRVYFMWDYMGRTLHMLYLVPASLPDSMSKEEKERYQDVAGRSTMGVMMIKDPLMSAMAFPGQNGKEPEFGEEVNKAADELDEALKSF